MDLLQRHRRWSKDQEVVPESHHDSNSLSSQQSLASVSSLTTKQPQTTATHQYLTTFKAHTSSISSLTLAGKHLFSGSADNQIRVWPRDDSATVPKLLAYGESSVKSMVVSGDKLFTGHHDHKIRVWKIDQKLVTSTRIATLETFNDSILYFGAYDRSTERVVVCRIQMIHTAVEGWRPSTAAEQPQ